jgi:hypothetical protein
MEKYRFGLEMMCWHNFCIAGRYGNTKSYSATPQLGVFFHPRNHHLNHKEEIMDPATEKAVKTAEEAYLRAKAANAAGDEEAWIYWMDQYIQLQGKGVTTFGKNNLPGLTPTIPAARTGDIQKLLGSPLGELTIDAILGNPLFDSLPDSTAGDSLYGSWRDSLNKAFKALGR